MINEKKVLAFDISSEGLEPLKHRIVGITLKTYNDENIIAYHDEERILREFWKYVKDKDFQMIVGFNSSNFDLPMLVVRSIKNRVQTANLRGKCVDLRKVVFGDVEKPKGTLQDFQKLLNITFENTRYDKMHMSLIWEIKDNVNLKEFLLRDVRITWKLYVRLRQVGLVD